MQAPHPPLRDYYLHEAERGSWVRQLFDRTAGDYDRIERVMAWGSGSWYRRRALRRAGLSPGMRVLDIGVGTGLTARQAALLGRPFGQSHRHRPEHRDDRERQSSGLDRAAARQRRVHSRRLGDCGLFCPWDMRLRHIADLSAAFSEFMRVLKPGGRICLLEITRPDGRLPRAVLRAYMRGVVPFLAGIVGDNADSPTLMRYYWDTIEACASPGQEILRDSRSRIHRGYRYVELGVFSEYCARKPP